MCTVGFTNVFQIYNFVIICELLAAFCVTLGKLHLISVFDILQWLPLNKSYLFITTTTSLSIIIVQNNIRFNFHTGILFGLFSIAWCGHLINVAIPISRGINLSCNLCLTCNGGLNWIWTHSLYLTADDINQQLLHNSIKASNYCTIPRIYCTIPRYLTDIAHHHLASGILFTPFKNYCTIHKCKLFGQVMYIYHSSKLLVIVHVQCYISAYMLALH